MCIKFYSYIEVVFRSSAVSRKIDFTVNIKADAVINLDQDQMRQAFLEEEARFGSRIFCPFLQDNICSIYEVRPYMCAAFIATTPPERCNPTNPDEPHYYKVARSDVMADLSFYYKSIDEPFISIMPVVVYEIMHNGYSYIAGISGLEGLAEEVLEDPEVITILKE